MTQHAPIKHIHNCSSKQNGYLMHLRNRNRHSQTDGTYMSSLSLSPLSTNSLNTKFHCAFSAMTVPISLSLSTPVPTLPGKTTMLQASVSRSQVQMSVKLHCSCTLPNLRCSTTHILSHTCGNSFFHEPRSLTKQI